MLFFLHIDIAIVTFAGGCYDEILRRCLRMAKYIGQEFNVFLVDIAMLIRKRHLLKVVVFEFLKAVLRRDSSLASLPLLAQNDI